MYSDIHRRLRDAVRRKPPEKLRTNSWFLLHDDAPARRLVLINDFLANNMTSLEHNQHSPDLVPADLYLFPRLKSATKGRRFCGVTDIIKNVAEDLKRLSQNGFQERMQHFYSRWQ